MSFSPAQDRPWLVVDDLGAERLTDWAAEVLFCIFNARHVARAHTLVASNVRPKDLAEPRLRSRFLDAAVCHKAPNEGEDYRQGRDRTEQGGAVTGEMKDATTHEMTRSGLVFPDPLCRKNH